eukprot:TRINITY_DN74159_c0_g1_i1.p1 TRINITY_DN74159_c0_g1~~TRINITY_DN74159_c0_g1_i1.p1  ORF type:complete len:647 (+),score=96.37 TRINITY_DN74159_c0_g1_i1:68-2008(+)
MASAGYASSATDPVASGQPEFAESAHVDRIATGLAPTQSTEADPIAIDQSAVSEGEGSDMLLSDEQVQSFIARGYLVLPPRESEVAEGLGPDLHAGIFRATQDLGVRADQLGNNILPALPDLARVYESRRVSGALKSLLGPGYVMHPHRFCHKSQPGRQAQTWHRDSYWGNWHPRSHMPYWVMALYFPQDTPVELGPTGILPFSQYYNKDEGSRGLFGVTRFSDCDLTEGAVIQAWQVREHPLVCRAGTVALIHYDLWHRGAANNTDDGIRFMFKFQFTRMISPSLAPRAWSFAHSKADWKQFLHEEPLEQIAEDEADAISAVLAESGCLVVSQMPTRKLVDLATEKLLLTRGVAIDKADTQEAVERSVQKRLKAERALLLERNLRPVWQGIWDWLCGKGGEDREKADADMRQCVLDLKREGDEQEPRRVAAAWQLGSFWATGDTEHAQLLVDSLQKSDSATKVRDRAVMQALEAAGAAVLPILLNSPALQRSPFAVRAMGRALDLEGCSLETHSRVLEQLSQLIASQDSAMRLCAVEALGSIQHPDAASVALRAARQDPDGDVRATACHSLLRVLGAGVLDKQQEVLHDAFKRLERDIMDRYVAAYAAEGAHRVKHRLMQQEAKEEVFVPSLIRWCSFGDGWMTM